MQNAFILHAVNTSLMHIWVSTQTYIIKLCARTTLYIINTKKWMKIHFHWCQHQNIMSLAITTNYVALKWYLIDAWVAHECVYIILLREGASFVTGYWSPTGDWQTVKLSSFYCQVNIISVDVTLRALTVLHNQQNRDHCCVIKCVFLRVMWRLLVVLLVFAVSLQGVLRT